MLPDQAVAREGLEREARRVLEAAGYRRIETPSFEATELFARGVGQSTDIVQKEMYTFDDGGGRSITLRPEGTAPVCRAYVEHGMHKLAQPVKLWYLSSFYRHEAPQAGRYRQFWQVGAEAVGSDDPAVDGIRIRVEQDGAAVRFLPADAPRIYRIGGRIWRAITDGAAEVLGADGRFKEATLRLDGSDRVWVETAGQLRELWVRPSIVAAARADSAGAGPGTPIELGDFDLIVLESPVVAGVDADGILGLPVLRRMVARFDFNGETLELGGDSPVDSDDGRTLPIRASTGGLATIEGRFVAPEAEAQTDDEAEMRNLLLDTGFSGFLHLPEKVVTELVGGEAAGTHT